MLSYAEDIESLHESFSNQFLEIDRMIVIDISRCWSGDFDSLIKKERCELIGDIRLLTDIFWLDDFEVKTDKGKEILLRGTPVYPI